MGVWKKIEQQDVSITPYNAKKNWYISGSDLSTLNVTFLLGSGSINGDYYLNPSDIYNGGKYAPIVYKSLDHLYYRGFNTASGVLEATSSYEHYLESSFASSSSISNFVFAKEIESIHSKFAVALAILFFLPKFT